MWELTEITEENLRCIQECSLFVHKCDLLVSCSILLLEITIFDKFKSEFVKKFILLDCLEKLENDRREEISPELGSKIIEVSSHNNNYHPLLSYILLLS